MYYNIVSNQLQSFENIILFEDVYGCQTDDDAHDSTYGGDNCDFNSDDEMKTIIPQPADGPSVLPLNVPYQREPNNSFHYTEGNPYLYYESTEYPSDDDYMNSIYVLRDIDNLLYESDEYEQVRMDELHWYIRRKLDDIDYRIPKRDVKVIMNKLREMVAFYERLVNEEYRIEDVSTIHD